MPNILRYVVEPDIDPFILEFSSLNARLKDLKVIIRSEHDKLLKQLIDKFISKILSGKYLRVGSGDFIEHEDGRVVPVNFSSSGNKKYYHWFYFCNLYHSEVLRSHVDLMVKAYISKNLMHIFFPHPRRI